MKSIFYLSVYLIFLFCSFGYAQETSVRKHIDFDRDWKFSFGSASDPLKDFNYGLANIFNKSGSAGGTAIDNKYNDSGWRKLDLPHDWAVELPFVNSPDYWVMSHGYKPVGGLFPSSSIGWYRKHFTIRGTDSGRKFQIQFDGIFRDANIWINGFYLGNNKSGYVDISIDITDFINFGKDNVITVRVDATQYEGWFYEGAGIYRHVWLNQYDNIHFVQEAMYIRSKLIDRAADLSIRADIRNENANPVKGTMVTYVTNRDGKLIAKCTDRQISLSGNETNTVTQTIKVRNVIAWSVEDPYLYRIHLIFKSNGKLVDEETVRYGFRTVRITKDGLFLNNKYVKIQGTNNHQDHAGVGSALPDYLQYYRIRKLKELGVNAYRTSHNAPAPELLDACDSLGMLVLDEQRLLNSAPEYMGQFERLLKRDRNRTCVFLWSIGNEEGWIQTTSAGKRIALSLLNKQKELDPGRTSTYAADVGNIWQGVNEVIPVRGFNYRQFAVQSYHDNHPNQPVVGTEMGSTVTTRGIYVTDSIHGYVPDQDITAPWWASKAETWWTLAAERPWWMGGFVWTGFDYRGEPTPYTWPDINSNFGIMDVCGFPKNIYYYYQSWWTKKDILHISPHWNGKVQGQPVDVWVNSNADNVELFLNGKSQGKKEMPRNSHLQWTIPYVPGTLEAIAYKNERKLMARVETTDKPSEVVVTPYKTTMLADGKDVTVINISVIDKQGRQVPDADNLIHFSLKGDAHIIGTGNGDPSSHEQDKFFDTTAYRHLFNGFCQVIVQSGTTKSKVHFEASSDSLYKGSTDIHTIQPGSPHMVKSSSYSAVKKTAGGVLGADISYLPQLESRGIKFRDKGIEKDCISILKDHGINYIRLRIFTDPASDSGYSPHNGFCDLNHTMQMAKRIKLAGLKFLLDFHYSDYWADPGRQIKPAAWQNKNFRELTASVYDYTKNVMEALKYQGTLPDMVQVGNEINHGMLWPEGHIGNLDSLAILINAGTKAIKEVAPATIIMLHIALGGQNDESRFFLDNMIARSVQFDVIGLSYYPKWHGTTDDLRDNLTDLASHYKKDLIVVEYSQLKRQVNDIVFNLPDNLGKGTFIWEPLNTWESVFDKKGNSNDYIRIYDDLRKEYLEGNKK